MKLINSLFLNDCVWSPLIIWSEKYMTIVLSSKSHIIWPKSAQIGAHFFLSKKCHNFWSPKQFLLHFYALSFFSDSKFVNFLLFFLIYFLFLANFTLKLVILHTVLEFTAFLSFIAVNGFKFTVYSNKSKNCKNGSHNSNPFTALWNFSFMV